MNKEMKSNGTVELQDDVLENVTGGANMQPKYDEASGQVICPTCNKYMVLQEGNGLYKCTDCGFEFNGVDDCPIW